jgi:hypothetical protein
MSIVTAIFASSGRMNNTTSSVYRDIRCGRARLARGYNISSVVALENKCPNTSMTKIKSIGERAPLL